MQVDNADGALVDNQSIGAVSPVAANAEVNEAERTSLEAEASTLIQELHARQLATISDMSTNQLSIFIKAQKHHLATINKGNVAYTSFLHWQKSKRNGRKIAVQVSAVGRRKKIDGSRTRRGPGRPKQPRVCFSQKIK